MTVYFRCTNCQRPLAIDRQKVGAETTCPICHHRQRVPDSTNPLSALRYGSEGAAKPWWEGETTPHLVSLAVALGMLGFLGCLIWIIPSASPQPRQQRPRSKEQPVNWAQGEPLPWLQPEIEISPQVVPAPPPSRRPPRPPNPLHPPPPVENRPPELTPPARSAKGAREEKPPPPNANWKEADSLGKELVKAAPEQHDAILKKLRQGKGPEYSQALATAIEQLSDEAKKKARQTLADRLTRFTAATLLAYLGHENPELRRAAALALGIKDDKDHVGELIDLLEDPEPSVVEAAQIALNKLTSPQAAPEKHAEARQTMPPPAQANPPAAAPQVARSRQSKKDDDLPDVGLVPPEEPSPAVQAIIQTNAIALFSKGSFRRRIEAAQVLGGLGEAGKPARRFLCAAMLDPVIPVQVAAADALKNIDPKMHYLAVLLATEEVGSDYDTNRVASLLQKIQTQGEDVEALAPLVANVVKFAHGNGARNLLTTALTALSRIGRKDLFSYRVVATALNNSDPSIRAVTLRGLALMKHGKLAVPKILLLLRKDTDDNRIAAMETLAVLADDSTEEIIADAIAAQRYDNNQEVRKAVEIALNKLRNKQNP